MSQERPGQRHRSRMVAARLARVPPLEPFRARALSPWFPSSQKITECLRDALQPWFRTSQRTCVRTHASAPTLPPCAASVLAGGARLGPNRLLMPDTPHPPPLRLGLWRVARPGLSVPGDQRRKVSFFPFFPGERERRGGDCLLPCCRPRGQREGKAQRTEPN